VLAITDHDTTAGLPAALAEAYQQEITVVPGVEVSTTSGREEVHLLGYFVDLNNLELQTLLAHIQRVRWDRARQMVARLARLGLPVEWDRVAEIAGGRGSIGRPHVAAALLEAGLVSSFNEAFDLWIGRGRPAYVDRYKLSPEETTQLLRRSGGIPVLAHPYIYSRTGVCKTGLDLRRWLPRLREAGLEGIEAYYPNYSRRVNRHLLALAVRYGLLITGGSDYHGGMLGNGLGSVSVPWAAWEGLKRRHRLMAESARPPAPTHGKSQLAPLPGQVGI
jgi:predicted metal-dependent phosphoesterase TrpH